MSQPFFEPSDSSLHFSTGQLPPNIRELISRHSQLDPGYWDPVQELSPKQSLQSFSVDLVQEPSLGIAVLPPQKVHGVAGHD